MRKMLTNKFVSKLVILQDFVSITSYLFMKPFDSIHICINLDIKVSNILVYATHLGQIKTTLKLSIVIVSFNFAFKLRCRITKLSSFDYSIICRVIRHLESNIYTTITSSIKNVFHNTFICF